MTQHRKGFVRVGRSKVLCVLLGICIPLQLACNRRSPPAEPTATSSPSPDQAALVNQILDRYTEAVGGQTAIDRITSYKAQGSFQSSVLRDTGVFRAWGKDPHKTLSVIEFPRIGTVKKGFNGENRWAQTPAGTVSDESPQQMAEVDQDAEVYRAGKIRNLYDSMSLQGKVRLNGRDVYLVEGKPVKGPTEKLFFDTDTGLLLRWDMVRRTPKRGNVFVKVHLDDYREVDGVKVPFKVRFAFESFDLTLKVDVLEHNVPIDDAVFEKPQ